jgi:NitT/TauT family transport system substrate-binding protein
MVSISRPPAGNMERGVRRSSITRRKFLGSAATLGLAFTARPYIASAAAREIIVTEPAHVTGFLPLYVAIANGYFADADVSVRMLTIDTGGGHTNAVLSGQAFAFIGGPEHNAFAKLKGAELRSVVNCIDRGVIYYCAAKGQEPIGTDWPNYLKGKTIAVSQYGATPNSITRYLLKKWKLDAKSDVTLVEVINTAIPAAVKSGQAQIGCTLEPFLTQGIRQGIWGEPFYNVPKELGPYAFSTLNVRLDSIQKEPELVRAFVRGMVKGLKFTHENPAEVTDFAKKQFPTMAIEDLKATLDRSFRDGMWSKNGIISRQGWDTAKAVVMEAGILKNDVKFEEIIDMSFVDLHG